MKWKICNKCGRRLPHTHRFFHKDSANKCGLRGDCKECNRKRVYYSYVPKVYSPPLGFRRLPYLDSYWVSKCGEVWSAKLGRLMKPYKHPKYKYLQLSINGKCKKVHQLILEAWIGLCPYGMEACHKDGNPENNILRNLYWGTRSDNVKDSVRHGTHPVVKLTIEKVKTIKQLIQNKVSNTAIAKIYNVDQSTISKIKNGKIWNYVHLG